MTLKKETLQRGVCIFNIFFFLTFCADSDSKGHTPSSHNVGVNSLNLHDNPVSDKQ